MQLPAIECGAVQWQRLARLPQRPGQRKGLGLRTEVEGDQHAVVIRLAQR